MAEPSALGVASAFAAGTISFLSPCVLPLVPGYVAHLAGQPGQGSRHRSRVPPRLSAFLLSLCFVAGFSTVFVALGASATALGQLLLRYKQEANLLSGVIIIVFGLFMIGLLRLPLLQRDLHFRFHIRGGRPIAAYIVGAAFGFGWTPCIGPVLGAILTLSAVSSRASDGIVLLGTYSLGLGVPFLVAALFTERLVARYREVKRIGRFLYIVAGVIMVLTGVAMVTGHVSAVAIWLLQVFPALGKIG